MTVQADPVEASPNQILLTLPVTIQTNRLSDRRILFEDLHRIFANSKKAGKSAAEEQAVKYVLRVLLSTLPRYIDKESRSLVSKLIGTLIQKYDFTPRILVDVINGYSGASKNSRPTATNFRVNLALFKWLNAIPAQALKSFDNGSKTKFVQIVTDLVFSSTSTECDSLKNKTYTKLKSTWKKFELNEFVHVLEQISSDGIDLVVIWGFVYKYCIEAKNTEIIPSTRDMTLSLVIKNVVGSKNKLDVASVVDGIKPVLKQMSHQDFKEIFLPAVQRAILRNPEIAFEIVVHIIAELQLDLSAYAPELGKIIGAQLHSKEDTLRDWAILGSQNLAKQCSNADSIQQLLKSFFAVFNGSEGKLTVLNQRFGVLCGIGALSCHRITGIESHQLSAYACEHFCSILKIEVHEGTLIHAASQMELWCAKLTKELPSFLVEWYKSSLNLKTSTSSVKAAYITCLIASIKENMASSAGELIALLSQSAQKAFTASTTQMPVLVEGLEASLLILKLCHFDKAFDSKAKIAITAILDFEKLPFLTEKFIKAANAEAQQALVGLLERLMLDYGLKLKGRQRAFESALVLLMTFPESVAVRKQAIVVGKKFLQVSPEPTVIGNMNTTFFEIFAVEHLKERKAKQAEGELQQSERHFNPSTLVEVLRVICYAEDSNKGQIVFSSLASAHVPAIYNSDSKVWLSILRRVVGFENVENFLKKNTGEIVSALNKIDNPEVKKNALKTIVKYFPDYFMTPLINQAIQSLENPDLRVTREEIEIFNTPDGELYDRNLVDNLRDNTNEKNIKKENKLYSYKEQMAEIELRKELDAKKKAQGELVEPQLNKKQLEAKKNQLEKEAAVRVRVQQLSQNFYATIDELYAIMEGNNLAVAYEVSNIIPPLVDLFSSPLCSQKVSQLFVDLSSCVFALEPELKYLGLSIGYVTLRQLKTVSRIDNSWTKEPLPSAVQRIITTLYKRTCRPTGRDYDEKTFLKAIEQRLTAPGFAYLFPFLSSILLSNSTSEENVVKCLQIVNEHAQIREQVILDLELDAIKMNLLSLKNPQYLPRKQLLSMLIQLIVKSPIEVEQLATKVLLNVVSAASGKPGCTKASEDEVKCLLDGLKSESQVIRLACIESLLILSDILGQWSGTELGLLLTKRVYVANFDPDDKCSVAARNLWAKCALEPSDKLCFALLSDIEEAEASLRHSLAGAADALLKLFPAQGCAFVTELIVVYKKNMKILPAVLDSFGRPTNVIQLDTVGPRMGVALVLTRTSALLPDESIPEIAKFLVPEALSDRNEGVQNQMLEAGIALVDLHGKKHISMFLNVFQEFLDEASNKQANDVVRKSVVILMGTVARHLEKDDPKVKPIVAKLIESLSTPSQIVQEAVANCLPPLISSFKDEAPTLVSKLLQLLLESDSYGERKGAAYGISGLVKGLGILSLKQLGIMDTLTEAIQDKKNPSHREGALFAFEMLCNMLGRLFEPYIIHILPNLLLCFGDNSQRVRQATDDTARAVMSKLSAHGVKLVLPSLLDALDEDSWRTKAGSIELLGAMAHCAPKQLSSCLPSIVPKLMTVLSDSHTKVQSAGAQALKQIGSVIRNPEIQAIVPVLLEALQDPANKTHKCLSIMLNTKFVHFIDAPSLALIMPVIERAFQGRSTETRKMAAQIIGNMYSLTDQKDLSPYLPSIIPGLKASLLDPVPEVRSVTARALGAMVKGMGEDIFEDLMPWLMATLTSEASSVDRSGAAQGLSEVIGGLGLRRLEKMMPEIIATSERTNIEPHVRDGYIMLFIFLPMVFTQDFTPFIGRIINPILKALADENEFVRDTALKAGQRIVNMYAETAIQLLLPELEQGLFDENWRIRYSSVQLLGDLLFKISGVTGKMTTVTIDEDDNFGTEQSYRAIINALGGDRRNRVLSGLYMGRSDVSLTVRQAALHVWKVVVTNTPRTLKEILPTLFSLLLGCLASASYDKQQVAARTLGDLVRKLGERVLPEIIPILEQGLDSDRADQRQGVCIGLSEIIASTSREMVQAFVDSLVPTVTKALYDPLPEVRQAAAKTFDSLHSAVGVRALDEILPPLLEQLADPVKGEATLDGLRQVMAIKSKVVLPYLVPQLTAPPINTRALALLSTVAGDSLSKHLAKILPALLQSLSEALDTHREKQEIEYCQTVILAVVDEHGSRTIVDYLLESARRESSIERRASVMLLYAFCCQTKSSLSSHVSQLLRGLILLFTDSNEQVLSLSWDALNSVTRSLDTKEQIEYVGDVRNAVRYAAIDLRNSSGKQHVLLPGFCLAKGIAPILPIFREAILNGNPEQKEQASHGLSEVIGLTSAEALKSSVVNIAGPLIRILGDRYAWNVKVAVLDTLSLLLSKVGNLLRPFVPQLQQTFLKALSDNHRQVRLKAANAISQLVQVHTRCDPVFQEIHSMFKTIGDDSSARETALYAFRVSVSPAGDKMSDAVRKSITATITSLLSSSDDNTRLYAAGCLGAMVKWFPDDELGVVMRDYLLDDDINADWTLRHGRSISLRVAMSEAPQRILTVDSTERITKTLFSYLTSDRIPLVTSGAKGVAYLLKNLIEQDSPLPTQLVTSFAKGMNHSNNEVKQAVASSVVFLSKEEPSLPIALLKQIVPLLVNGTKEKNTMVKAHSEQALVAVLRLRKVDDNTSAQLIAALDPGAREALQDCMSKVLKRVASQAEPKEENFDDTLVC